MKTIRLFALPLLLAFAGLAQARTIEVEVNGLVCAFCAQGIQKSLKKLPGADDVFVSLEHRLVAVQLTDGADIADQALKGAIADAGYSVVKITRSDTPLSAIRARLHAENAGE